jgi:hypothetical protein
MVESCVQRQAWSASATSNETAIVNRMDLDRQHRQPRKNTEPLETKYA